MGYFIQNLYGLGQLQADYTIQQTWTSNNTYALQLALLAKGFKLPKYGADGKLGHETAKVLKQANIGGTTSDKWNIKRTLTELLGFTIENEGGFNQLYNQYVHYLAQEPSIIDKIFNSKTGDTPYILEEKPFYTNPLFLATVGLAIGVGIYLLLRKKPKVKKRPYVLKYS